MSNSQWSISHIFIRSLIFSTSTVQAYYKIFLYKGYKYKELGVSSHTKFQIQGISHTALGENTSVFQSLAVVRLEQDTSVFSRNSRNFSI